MPLVVLRFSLHAVDTNASHTEPVEENKERNVCEMKKKSDLENIFLVDTNMSLFSNVFLPM